MNYIIDYTLEDDIYIYTLVSKNIKYFRQLHNKNCKREDKLTQEKLAERADLSHSLIADIESEKYFKSFSISTLYRISKSLDVDIHEFFIDRWKDSSKEKIHVTSA